LAFNMGNELRARGEWEQALALFRLSEEAVPGFPDALGSQGAALMKLGRNEDARNKLKASLAGDSISRQAWRNLAIIDSLESGL